LPKNSRSRNWTPVSIPREWKVVSSRSTTRPTNPDPGILGEIVTKRTKPAYARKMVRTSLRRNLDAIVLTHFAGPLSNASSRRLDQRLPFSHHDASSQFSRALRTYAVIVRIPIPTRDRMILPTGLRWVGVKFLSWIRRWTVERSMCAI